MRVEPFAAASEPVQIPDPIEIGVDVHQLRQVPRHDLHPAVVGPAQDRPEEFPVDGVAGDPRVVLRGLEVERRDTERSHVVDALDGHGRRAAVGLETGHVVVHVDPGPEAGERGHIDGSCVVADEQLASEPERQHDDE